MQNLYDALTRPIIEYKDGGTIEQRPATPIMQRAARSLQQLAGINANNQATILSLQKREAELLVDLERANDELKKLRNDASNPTSVGEPILPPSAESTDGGGI